PSPRLWHVSTRDPDRRAGAGRRDPRAGDQPDDRPAGRSIRPCRSRPDRGGPRCGHRRVRSGDDRRPRHVRGTAAPAGRDRRRHRQRHGRRRTGASDGDLHRPRPAALELETQMRITGITSRIISYDVSAIYGDAGPPQEISADYRYSFDTIHTDEGIDGHSMQFGWMGEGQAMGHALHQAYGRFLMGRDVGEHERLWQELRRQNRHEYNLTDTLL